VHWEGSGGPGRWGPRDLWGSAAASWCLLNIETWTFHLYIAVVRMVRAVFSTPAVLVFIFSDNKLAACMAALLALVLSELLLWVWPKIGRCAQVSPAP